MVKLKETELAKVLIDSFDGTEYEVYQEVATPYGSADVVLKYDLIWAIECKLGMSLTVLAQARYNLKYFNYSSIALPSDRYGTKTYNFGMELCKVYGIGIFIVYKDHAREVLKAKLQRRALVKHIKFTDFQKTKATAGAATGYCLTPFQHTVEQLIDYIKTNPGCKLKDAMNDIKHHYASISSAQGSIRKWIKQGVIQGIVIDRGICNLEKPVDLL